VLRAERSRLERMRWVARLKVTLIALVGAVVIGAAAYAAKKYQPDLLKRPPPPPPTPVMKNQETAPPAPSAKALPPTIKAVPKKKDRSSHKSKGHTTAAPTEEPAEKAVEDAPMPPSPE
jgi:hypothetical protein